MQLKQSVAYEKLGNTVYLSADNGIFLLENEMSAYIFELLKKEHSLTEIKEKVKNFKLINEYSMMDRDKFVENLLAELYKNSIIY
ncbi:PqqD family peptide modification chaperone [Enterococcus hirae]|nr:PqqD family peptide modification chaperone [Enterococcus hirae]